MKRRFKVVGLFDLASRPQTATITIDPEVGLFSVRPHRRHREYETTLVGVAEWVVRSQIAREVSERKSEKSKKRRVKVRRSLL